MSTLGRGLFPGACPPGAETGDSSCILAGEAFGRDLAVLRHQVETAVWWEGASACLLVVRDGFSHRAVSGASTGGMGMFGMGKESK